MYSTTGKHGILLPGIMKRQTCLKNNNSSTVSSSCVRLLSAIACEGDSDLCHFDVDQAFVQSDLEEDVFLRLPKGCGVLSGKVVRLNKRLYIV